MRFEAFDDEKIFGMGQYQDDFLDKKGCILELAHRNSQASVPFMISSRGYGFLWNNPAIGTASFAKNKTEWTALNTKKLDYWICAGDSPKQLTELYSAVTGRVPIIPEYGIWILAVQAALPYPESCSPLRANPNAAVCRSMRSWWIFSIGLCRVISSLIQRTGRIRRQ